MIQRILARRLSKEYWGDAYYRSSGGRTYGFSLSGILVFFRGTIGNKSNRQIPELIAF
jgi:hypothetical protein